MSIVKSSVRFFLRVAVFCFVLLVVAMDVFVFGRLFELVDGDNL